MTRNDITNDTISTGPDEAQDKYAKGWEAIFGKKKESFEDLKAGILLCALRTYTEVNDDED